MTDIGSNISAVMLSAIRAAWHLHFLLPSSSYCRVPIVCLGRGVGVMGKGHKRQKSYAADLELPSVASNTHLPDLPKPKLRRSNRIEGIKSVHELEASVEVPDDDTQASSLYSDENITHHLGNLTPCRIVARPSKTIKSPYVADIIPLAGPHKGDVKLAHAPNLDCCMTVVPGSIVYCSENTNKLTKTQYAIQVCSDRVDMKDITLQEAEREYTYVGYHPTLAEILAKSFLNSPLFRLHAVKDLTQSPTFTFSEHLTLVNSMLCKGQVTIGDSRVDYMLSSPPAHPATTLSTSATAPSILVEVKNVVCAECCGVIDKAQRKVRFGVYRGDDGGMEGERQRGAGYVCISKRVGSECKGGNEHVPKKCAIFPAGKKKAGTGVVSTRAIKHIQNLITLCSNSNTHKAALVFIVNRSDCDAFRPCHEACMLFSQMLYRASLCENIDIMAVEVEYVTTNVAADGETVEKDSEVSSSHWDGHVNFVAKITRELPVLIAKVVMDKPVDEDHLRRVLEAAE